MLRSARNFSIGSRAADLYGDNTDLGWFVLFSQVTITFMSNTRPQAKRLADWIQETDDHSTLAAMPSLAGTADACGVVHLLTLALGQVKSKAPPWMRDALGSEPLLRVFSAPECVRVSMP